jgi:hypothetical protein
VTITPTAEATEAAKPALSKGQLMALKPPRLPYHEAVEERFGIDRAGWKALVEAIYPNAETADAIVMALSYCRARNLDPFKRPVHIVPMWSSVAGKMIETVWPGISELRCGHNRQAPNRRPYWRSRSHGPRAGQFCRRSRARGRCAPWVDSDAKCNTLGRSGSPRKDRIFPPSPPPSAAIRRCEGGSDERKIE